MRQSEGPSSIEIPVRQTRFVRSFFFAASTLTLIACADESAVPDGDPRKGGERSLRGVAYREDALADAEGRFHWAQAAIDSYRPADQNLYPARIEPLDTGSCFLTKPKEGDVVRHVIVERGVGAAPLYQMSEDDIGARAKRYVDSYVATGGKAKPSVSYDDADVMRLVNVVVTEKSAPVHLVLTSETNVIWNILPAAGVTISAIAVISGDGAGVAHAPEGAVVEALYGEALRRCDVQPARRPKEDWSFVQNAKGGGGAMKEALADNNARASAYASWFMKRFGASAEAGAVAHRGLGAVLIGPMPAGEGARVPMATLEGATVLLSRSDHFVLGARRDYQRKLGELTQAAAAAAAGGDLKGLLGS